MSSSKWAPELSYIKRKWCVQEDVVISGMSGRFPKSDSVQEFAENLFNGVDMMTGGNDRFPSGIDGFPLNSGKVENLENFDADFFQIPRKHANLMDPQLRKLLEASFESIVDAGIEMKELRGSNTGFYYASFIQETDKAFGNDPYKTPAYLQQHSTIVSQVFGLKGPIGHYDTACGSSFSALNEAFTALKSGLCDRALVAGYNICLRPMITLEFNDLQMVSPSGHSKSLDKSADGYGRSEAICCVMLQLRPEAKRIYSTIVNSRSNNDGYKEQGITFPSMTAQRRLIAETYDEVGLDPSIIDYVEAHATGTQAGDPVELEAIYDIFCQQRSSENPLKIGCIKSNMGHSEAASGLCALIKANVIFQCGYIPPNLHLKEPNPKIKGLMDGKMMAIVEKTSFNGEYISLNSFGFGGSNAHVILKRHAVKSSESSFEICNKVPRLVPICSRTLEGIQRIQTFLKKNQHSLTREFFCLLNNYLMTPLMPYRGYTLITEKDEETVFENSMPENQLHNSHLVALRLPAHPFKFDAAFQHIPVFSRVLNRLINHSKALDLNLNELLFGAKRKTSIIEETVSVTARQILLISLLKAIKIPINFFIGDTIGQLAYASAKNLINEAKAIEIAYWLGHYSEHGDRSSEKIRSLLTQKEVTGGIISAMDDDKTLSNQADFRYYRMDSNKGSIFDSASSNGLVPDIPTLFEQFFHELYDSVNGDNLELSQSCQVPGKMTALQRTNAGIIDTTMERLPYGSILVDLGESVMKNPHLKRIRFSKSQHLDPGEFMKCVGQLYAMHLPVDIRSLYPSVDYPVPIDTLSLHSLIEFDHSHKYEAFKYPEYFKYFSQTSSFVFKVSLSDAGDLFYSDHKIDGRILFPATGILMQVWLVVAEYHHVNLRKSKVLFSNVSLIRATMLSEKEATFKVDYMPETKSFITSESDTPIATGKVFLVNNIEEARENFRISTSDGSPNADNHLELSKEDVYKELKNRGYDYGPSFRCLTKADQFGRRAEVQWREVSSLTLKGDTIFEKAHEADFDFLKTWITFSDSVLQLAILSNRYNRGLFLPTAIDSMLIDAERIMKGISVSPNLDSMEQFGIERERIELEEDRGGKSDHKPSFDGRKNSITFSVQHDLRTRTLSSEGLWIRGLKTSFASRRAQKVLLETQDFIPFNERITIEPKYQKELGKYLRALKKCFSLLLNKPSMKHGELDTLKQEIDFEKNSSFAFLGNLISTLEQDKREINSQEMAHDILLGGDLQFSSLSRFLKPFLMIPLSLKIYCGSINPSISILEHNDGENILQETIRSTIDNQSTGMTKLSYTLACSTLNPEVKKMISGQVTLIEWDAESPLKNSTPIDLLIYKNHSGNIKSLHQRINHLIQAIQPEGFLLIVFREKINQDLEKICSIPQVKTVLDDLKNCLMKGEDIISLMEDMNWICVSDRALEPDLLSIRGLLFRRKISSIEEPRIVHVTPTDFHWLNDLNKALKESDGVICLIGDPEFDQGVVGFMKSFGLENSGDRVTCIANRYHDNGINLKNVDWKNLHFKQILGKKLKFNIFDPVQGWGEYIHLEVEEKHEEDPGCLSRTPSDVELKVLQPGDLSSLKWCESTIKKLQVELDRSFLDICYASLNFKDIMLASGRLPMVFEPGTKLSKDDSIPIKIGLEYSGVDDKGNRLMGMKSSGAMASRVLLDPTDFVWPVPDDWTLEDAATVPVVYATVIYGLIMRGNLKRGESVLIHAGSGGVGIAAINICSSYDCTIYTTVGTPEKRRFIMETFPHLNEANIGNSRDTSFEELIFRQTDGRGVDIVLNSLADDKLQASVRCLAPGGRFIEIGKYDGFKNSPVDLGWLDQDRSFHGVMLDALFDPTEDEMVKVNHEKNQLQDLVTQFLKNGVIKPLIRIIFEMKHAEDAFRYMAAGKHIGKVLIKIRDSPQIRELSSITALNSVNFQANKAYIIIGGFGGLGLEVASWLVSRGARHIVINSRNGPRTPYHQYCLDKMIENNVQVIISKHDLTTEIETRELLSSLSVPLGGIFNSALVLRDALFVDQTAENFTQVCASKVNITANLDRITREICPKLDYFVVFSSIVSGRGNPGQTNYSLANSFMESVCERRRRDGLHGLAIQWGFVGDVGYVVEKIGADIESIRGTAPQRLHSCLATLERILTYPNAIVSSVVRSEGKKIDSSGDITKSVCHILGIKDSQALDPKISLGELGMDSLMAIEVQQALDRNFNVSMTFREIRQLKICDLMALSTNSDSRSMFKSKSKPMDFDLKKESESLPREPTTKLNNGTGELLFVLPPIEGHYQPFTGLFENLDHSVIGLNWTYDLAKVTTIEEAAGLYADKISKLTSQTKINLIGYSFGGILALAIVKILEERQSGPKVSKLALLDADPEYLRRWVLKMVFSHGSSHPESFREEEYIKNCLKRYLKDISKFDEYLKRASTKLEGFEEAKKFLISEGVEPLLAENLMKLNELTFQKLALISKYHHQKVPNCKIIHFRSRDDFSSLSNIDKDNSIGEQHFFDGNHNNFISKNLTDISIKIIQFFKE